MFHIEPNSPQHLKVGKAGEDIACKYLENKGYKIMERNFIRKWGEIDIICLKGNNKSSIWNKVYSNIFNVLRKTNNDKSQLNTDDFYVPQGTGLNKLVFVEVKTLKNGAGLNPEDNLTESKKKKLIRTCELYVSDNPIYINTEWQIDAILIKIDHNLKKASIRHIESAIY
ncbi:MAG: YraN family protein [bacterium]|nr:YraN family protein [bacterium]